VAGTGRESTPGTIAACRRAADAGADAVLVRTPSFFKARMTTELFIRHYEAVADASPVPVLLYNVTVFTGVALPGEAVSALARHENVIGLKDSGSDLAIVADFIARGGDGFTVLSGSAPTLYPSLCLGAGGAVLAVAGVIPDLCARIYDLVQQGDHAAALALQRRIAPLAHAVGSRFGVPGLKAALDMIGFTGGDPRGPLLPAAPEARAAIRA
jgi:4-hydroxy-2-oxoglutarate aldolase